MARSQKVFTRKVRPGRTSPASVAMSQTGGVYLNPLAYKTQKVLRRGAHRPGREMLARPGFSAFLLAAVAIFTLSYIGYHPQRGLLNWFVTIIWSASAPISIIGLVGASVTWQRIRQATDSVDPWESPLIVVVPTIGRRDVYPALKRSVESFVEHLPKNFCRLRIDVVVEEMCEARSEIEALAEFHDRVRVIVIPQGYRTKRGTLFKARANHYAHELRILEGEVDEEVWVLHMDDDTAVGSDTSTAIAAFLHRQRHARRPKHLAQGVLTYPVEYAVNRFTWLADAVRPSDDIGRFAAITGSGTPVNGLHGELMLVRASVEAAIGWDFGPHAITEDSHAALLFSARFPGRSGCFVGRSYGASPASVKDLLRQRRRWAAGLTELVLNRSIPLRYRAWLAYGVASWVTGPVQNLAVALLLALSFWNVNISPVAVPVMAISAINFGYTVWMYWEGLKVNVGASVGRDRPTWGERVQLVLLFPVFSLLEGLGGALGFIDRMRNRPEGFDVIRKPL